MNGAPRVSTRRRGGRALACLLACMLPAILGVGSAGADIGTSTQPAAEIEGTESGGGAEATRGIVDVVNRSEPTLCAENDNVDLRLQSIGVARFRVEAVQPVYGAEITVDSTGPDWRDCPGDTYQSPADYRFAPREVVLFEDDTMLLRGYAFDRFWRPEKSLVRIAGQVEQGLHLLQLWWKQDGRQHEVIALYPTDGYWRLRPLPLPQLDESVYGSSFVIGPIEDRARPIVDLAAVDFDPRARRFALSFRRGGGAVVRIDAVDTHHLALDVALQDMPADETTFVAIRSMYVNRYRADASAVIWRGEADELAASEPIMGFARLRVRELRLARTEISMHNTSAPDLVFREFR